MGIVIPSKVPETPWDEPLGAPRSGKWIFMELWKEWIPQHGVLAFLCLAVSSETYFVHISFSITCTSLPEAEQSKTNCFSTRNVVFLLNPRIGVKF